MNKMFETTRMIIKPMAEADKAVFIASQQNPEFKTYTGGVQTTEAATEKFIKNIEFYAEKGFGFFSVFLKDNAEWLGQIGITTRTTTDFVELGWGFLPQFQGKGYAFEAATGLLEWCRENFGWHEFYFCISPLNLPSVRLAKKLGAFNIGIDKVPEELKTSDVEIWYLKQ